MQQHLRYFNVHTHCTQPETAVEGVLEIVNYYEKFDTAATQQACSMGLHPWYLSDPPAQLKALKEHAARQNVKAIGECGLDKLCDTPWAVQEEAFTAQIQLANELNKPLIIHCVRAYSEALQLLDLLAKVPVIFHGFNKKLSLAKQIIDKGYYLSFGAALLTGKNVRETFAQLPDNCFFLETDGEDVEIREIYWAAASIRKTGEDVIILQLQQQYKNVFGNDE